MVVQHQLVAVDFESNPILGGLAGVAEHAHAFAILIGVGSFHDIVGAAEVTSEVHLHASAEADGVNHIHVEGGVVGADELPLGASKFIDFFFVARGCKHHCGSRHKKHKEFNLLHSVGFLKVNNI